MKTYQCLCGQPIFFNNSLCVTCGRGVGFDPLICGMQVLEVTDDEGVFQKSKASEDESSAPQYFRYCTNLNTCGCNWLVPGDPEGGGLCASCSTTRVLPDLTIPGNLERWSKLESAKRRLLYTLLDVGLWGANSTLQVPVPLVFDFLQTLPGGAAILTGHDNGVITLNVQEADDDIREKTRLEMREPYRSLLGHFRHESGHYYWDVLIRDTVWLPEYRALFGDETTDYAASLQKNYLQGADLGWELNHITTYAASHPWEDWAETWAHWLHMHDTLETAAATQCQSNIIHPVIDTTLLCGPDQEPDADCKAFCGRISEWVALTTLVNELTRSMGQPDAYPFISSTPVLKKLYFIDKVVRELGIKQEMA
jgi:hypothetical protein